MSYPSNLTRTYSITLGFTDKQIQQIVEATNSGTVLTREQRDQVAVELTTQINIIYDETVFKMMLDAILTVVPDIVSLP